MPVVKPEVLSALRTEREQDGEAYFWSLGADLARKHSQHRKNYEQALRDPKLPDSAIPVPMFLLCFYQETLHCM